MLAELECVAALTWAPWQAQRAVQCTCESLCCQRFSDVAALASILHRSASVSSLTAQHALHGSSSRESCI